MNGEALTPVRAANTIIKWCRAYLGGATPFVTDLSLVQQMLPGTPYGKGVHAIKGPAEVTWAGCEGALVRNPRDPADWGIFYNPTARPERRRFTIAHELGHFVLHREQVTDFRCASSTVYSASEALAQMEREANVFASNLLMPGDLFAQAIRSAPIDLHYMSKLAARFEVSFEALCIRFIEFTEQRAILVCWDDGFLDYECRSTTARLTRTRVLRNAAAAEPPPGTVAAEKEIDQEWNGIDLSAKLWCSGEPDHISLREFKHTYHHRNRVLSLLIFEPADPRPSDSSWQDDRLEDTYDPFIASGQNPIS